MPDWATFTLDEWDAFTLDEWSGFLLGPAPTPTGILASGYFGAGLVF